jgi:hypothetical protein
MPTIKKDSLLIFILLAFTFGFFSQDPGSNGNSRLGLTFALVEEGRITIDSYHRAAGTDTVDSSIYNEHYFSDKAPGSSLLGALIYLPLYKLMQVLDFSISLPLLKRILTYFVVGLPSAFAGTLIYHLGSILSKNRFRALIVTLSIMLGTMAFPYSILFYGHQLAAALLLTAFYMIFKLQEQPELPGSKILFMIGLLLGLSLMTELTTTVIVIPLILYYFFILWKQGSLQKLNSFALPALGGILPLVLMMAYNQVAFEDPFSIGYQHLGHAIFREGQSTGFLGIGIPNLKVLYYITVHPAHGIFWHSPVLLMSIAGMFFMFRVKTYRAELLLVTVIFAAYLLINAGYFFWWGGFAFGPRHLIPMLPFLALPMFFIPQRTLSLVIILGLISVTQMIIVTASVIQVPERVIVQVADLQFFQYSSIWSYAWQQLLNGNFAWNLGQTFFGLKGWASLSPLLLVDTALIIFFAIISPSRTIPSD